MRKFVFKSAFILLFSFLMIGEISAQLITDSDKRLKTQNAKDQPSAGGGVSAPSKSPFAAFRKKQAVERRTATSSSSYFADRGLPPRSTSNSRDHKSFFPASPTSPRYSPASPFSNKSNAYTTPRYSKGNPFESDNFFRSPKYSIGNVWSKTDMSKYPRYSVGNVWSKTDLSKYPRYSVGNVWSNSDLSRTPRYSVSDPFKGYNYFRSPKYSVGNVWSKTDLSKYPRYSVGNVWSNSDLSRTPRYSVGNVWSTHDLNRSPRYSVGQIWSTKDLNKSPRYSVGIDWSSKEFSKSPRYSVGIDWSSKEFSKSPRYSAGIDWSSKEFSKSPRYSVGNPYEGYKFLNVPPQYSTNKDRFVVDKRGMKENHIFELEAPYYTGNFKVHWNKTKNMHPSFNHHYANQSIEVIRDSMRTWNIFWVRLNGNKEDPKGVKEKVSEPKFDRKEADIWHD